MIDRMGWVRLALPAVPVIVVYCQVISAGISRITIFPFKTICCL